MSSGADLWGVDRLGHGGWDRNIAPALAAWGIDGDAKATRLSLSENATWRIDMANGDCAVLRLHRPGYRHAHEIRSEILWLEDLARQQAIPVAAPRRTRDGAALARIALPGSSTEQIAVLFDMVEGKVLESEDMQRLSYDCGRLAGLLQTRLQAWVPPADFTRPVLDVEMAIGRQGHWGYWGDHPQMSATTRAVLAEVDAKLRAQIAAYGRPEGRYGLIHGDMRAANMIAGQRGLTLIDFDDCAISWHLYELACAMTFVETDPGLDRMVADWLRGFTESRPLDAEDLAMVPTFLMLRRMLIVGWFATHQHTVEAQTMAADYAMETEAIARAYLEDRFVRL